MNDSAFNPEDIFSILPSLGFGKVPLKAIINEHQQLFSTLNEYDPLRLATAFSGLLTVPELQSNCIRLEALVYISLALGRGSRKPTDKIVSSLFTELGKGTTGRHEDPAEDVFVSLISTPRGNFRIIEGVWESAGFYLQRTVDALELLPADGHFDQIRNTVYALLSLSDIVCERTKLRRYELGNQIPQDTLSRKTLSALSSLRRAVKFSEADLKALGLSLSLLSEFGFNPSTRFDLAEEEIGHSSLERNPVAYRNGDVFLMLPTAVSAAIRRYVVEEMEAYNLREMFAGAMAIAYANLFSNTSLLGLPSGAPVEFQRTDSGFLASVMMQADHGLYINLVFFVDTLEDFENNGLLGAYPAKNNVKLAEQVDVCIDNAYVGAHKMPGFRECLTVLVGCGIGRAIIDFTSEKERRNWQLEFISASDLLTLSSLRDFTAISLWRLLEAQARLEQLGVTLQNVNGLLNLIGWARSLGGHLVPHGDLPEDFADGEDDRSTFIMIEQNALRSVRHEAALQSDVHSIRDIEGSWVKVQKEGKSLFEEDRNTPFYVAEEDCIGEQWPSCVYESSTRPWWVELHTAPEIAGYWAFERAQMLKTWLCRMVPILEDVLPELPLEPLLWRVTFEGKMGDRKAEGKNEFMAFDEAIAAISVEAHSGSSILDLVIGPAFEDAIRHPENIAERALITRSIEGFAQLAGRTLSKTEQEAVVQRIAPNTSARQSHAFMARRFRDFVRDSVWISPVTVDADDAALIKLGLGWCVRDRKLGGDIRGKANCTAYLSDIVQMLENELCEDLRQLDRRSVIMFALMNHESAVNERDNWRRTAGAVLALHSDREAALQTIAEHEAELNAVFQASRLLVEFAICECPMTGGQEPGRRDVSRLMAKVLLIPAFGGWSDAIHWDAMEPRLRITPLGDIHANVAFHNEIISPYGRLGIDLTVADNIKNYAKNLDEPEIKSTDANAFGIEFNEALEEQFGASFHAIRTFVDAVENIGIKRRRAIFTLKKGELLDAIEQEHLIEPDAAATLIDALTFKGRPQWRSVPDGYEERDRFPWRFRRRLSVLRMPLIELDEEQDPAIIVAPGIVRDAVVYMIGNYHRGDYPLRQLKPKMKRWAGESRKRMGREFSIAVAERLKDLGWKAEPEVRVTKLLQKGFEQDYGDVDVLAWRDDTNRVLLIECKDVQHRKTDGEIAEQLGDFRGELGSDSKPDHLLRHLRRIEIISAHPLEVAKYLGFSNTPQIEGHLVFKNPVPMKFAWKRMESRVTLHLFSELDSL